MRFDAVSLWSGQLRDDLVQTIAVLLSGLLLGLSFAPFELSWFAWIALVPPLVSVSSGGMRRAFIHAWIFYLGCFLVAFSWPMTHMNPETALVSGLAWLAITLLLAVPFGIARSVADRVPSLGAPAVAAVGVLLLEELLRIGPIPMPWNSMAYTQSGMDVFIRATSVIGSEGLSIGIVWVNVLLAGAVLNPGRASGYRLVAVVAIPVLILATGLFSSHPVSTAQQRVAVLQPGMDASSWADISDDSRVDTLLQQSGTLTGGDGGTELLLVWPETALPAMTRDSTESEIQRRLSIWSRDHSVDLLTGAIIRVTEPNRTRDTYHNSALLFRPDGTVQEAVKRWLVPFAEFVPFSDRLDLLNHLAVPAGGVSGYVPGTDLSLLHARGVDVGVLICFESAFPGHARKLVSAGSRLLVVITQDGWWNGLRAPGQHFEMARFRAAEEGRATVQVSVNGLSGVIDADGMVLQKMEPFDQQGAVYSVPVYDGSTFYQKTGGWMSRLVLGIWIAVVGFHGLRKRKR